MIDFEKRKKKLKQVTLENIEKRAFVKIPLDFWLDKTHKWSDLTMEAKLLYSFMYERNYLSLMNHWSDKENRAYIFFSIEEIMEYLCCANKKAIKIKKELLDVGLIEEKRLGQGHPNMIYLNEYQYE